MLVKELSDKAMEVMKSMDYQPCTITSIYSSSIRPILDYYLAEGIEEYDPNLRSQIETMYLEQYREGTISRSTYYKRLRGTDIFDAVHETGAYEWRKHASDVIAPVQSYSGTISEHLSTRKLNPKSLRAERMYLGEFSIFCADYCAVYVVAMFMLMLMYFAVQMERSIERAEQAKKIAEQSRDLTEKQAQIMMSQIQPHFIYNTLGSISSLCEEDPLKARDVTDRFAMYLRVNMANMKKDRLIPFDDEWEHTKTYLWIEQMRFENYLRVESNITCTNFKLPPLSLQPLVENAVKHGITLKPEGGTVTISTHEEADCYVVRITDDGLGFDTQSPAKDGKLHVGIENVKNRVEMLCGGKLIIKSEIGVGTSAEIIIPKEEKAE